MTLIDRPRMQVLAGGKDITDRCDSITFSAVDRGGYEIATLGLPAADRPTKGTRITIRQGLEVAWDGRVAEVVDHSIHGRATKTTGCEGWQALLKDNPMQMIYVDRQLAGWGEPSRQRQINLLAQALAPSGPRIAPDPTNGLPSVQMVINGSWTSPIPIVEALYDAGDGNKIGSVYYDVTLSQSGGSWTFTLEAREHDDQTGASENLGNLAGSSAFAGTFTPAVVERFMAIYYFFNAASGTPGDQFQANLRNLAVYGNHGLTKRGGEPGGFYPSDIVQHVLNQVAGVGPGVIPDSTSYIAPHAVYRTPTAPADIVNDMAKLLGWTWGVWEPATILGSEPRLDFRPPPTDATCVISKAECDELDITSRLGDLYDTAIVSYTDPAGTVGEVTVKLPNAQLYELGLSGRTLELEAGLSERPAAEALGLNALALSQIAARGAGQATLPVSVRLVNGASKPACLLRPGIDRIRIVDLVDGGPMLEQGTSRRDVFRISRIETTVSKDGSPNTRVELDQGTNLLETLQARLALAAGVVGSGAVG